jgi:hypothetical protein
MTGSVITYILTKQENHWGVQARFAAGASGIDAEAGAPNAEAGRNAVSSFIQAWNGHDPAALAATLHYPHVRIGDGRVEIWRSAAEFLAGPEPGRQRTWHETKLDEVKVVQTTLTGVNLTVRFSRLGRDGRILSKDEGVFLAALRAGVWKLQARSTMGS